jgi:glyoxylase-like metal-dependent hydrolase (beta-lactamase superfamily II)
MPRGSMLSWTIGQVTVTCIQESENDIPAGFLIPGLTAERVAAIEWLDPAFLGDAGTLRLAIQALVIRTPARIIVVDTCLGNEKFGREIASWNGLNTAFLDDLAAAGFDPRAVDTVFCTHLHSDHVGWNTMKSKDGWVPTFPNARYLLGREEFEFWDRERQTGKGSTPAVFADSILPLFEAGLVDLIDLPHRVSDEIVLVPTPGHTPGHASVEIRSQGQAGLITGDFIHHPCQMAVPDLAEIADTDGAMAAATRRQVLGECADRPILVIGTHFARPAAGHVRKDGTVFRFET